MPAALQVSVDQHSHRDSFSADRECLYNILWQSIHYPLRQLSLDQSGGLSSASKLNQAPPQHVICHYTVFCFWVGFSFHCMDFPNQPELACTTVIISEF